MNFSYDLKQNKPSKTDFSDLKQILYFGGIGHTGGTDSLWGDTLLHDGNDVPFFVDHNTKRTTWDDPRITVS